MNNKKTVNNFWLTLILFPLKLLIILGQLPGVLLILIRPSQIVNFLFSPLKKRPGRPRKKAWLPFQIKRTREFFWKIIPPASRLKLALILIIPFVFLYSLFVAKLTVLLPSPTALTTNVRPQTTQILDRNNEILYQIYGGQNRKPVKLSEISPYLTQATIAIEDKHFFSHPGVDFLGILRAAWINFTEGRIEGGSTLTQQLIKNTLLTSDQTIKRKVKEALLAFLAERIYSKEEILTMYLNEAPYGGPNWGVQAASEMYFGKDVRSLSLAEATYLAGLPGAPTFYSPYGTHPEEGKKRQAEVLRRMVEDRYITQSQAEEALKASLTFRPPIQEIKAPHFVMYVRKLLADRYGERVVSQGGLKVVTTLDLSIQEMAENTVMEEISNLRHLRVSNGSAMIGDAKTGQILAMVGSKDYFDPNEGNFNVALAPRQPGSSIKPITYAAAFKEGFSPGTILLDTPTTFPNPWGQAYSPVNYDGSFHGPVTIRTALGSSYNVPAVKTLAMIGIPAMLKTAREMGVTTLNQPDNYGLSLTLGGGAVPLIEMMTAYGILAARGVKHEPIAILSVTDPYGNKLEEYRGTSGTRALTEEVAYLITNILTDDQARAPAFGSNSLLQIKGKDVAVKTGTSDNKRDNWTFGYTPEYVVGVWVGNNDNSPMDPKLSSGITGAAPIWHTIMTNLLANRPNIAFKKPAGIIETVVDGNRDLAISGQTPKTVVGLERIKEKDETTGQEKETITYHDPFSRYTLEGKY